MKRLFDIGFQVVGHWSLSDGEMKLQLDRMQDEINVLYAFVVGDNVKYVGKTTQPLNKRMSGYLRPGSTQTTNIKNKANILSELKDGRVVLILALQDNGLHHYGTFHINIAAGLEDDLIKKLNPEWNGGRKETAGVTEAAKQKEPVPVSLETISDKGYVHKNTSKPYQPSISLPDNHFILTLHSAYFNSGFFNVGVRHQHLFGSDLEDITISCNGLEKEIKGYINRSANTNHTPRIMGGVPLKRWLQDVSELNGHILVEVISPNAIRMELYQ